MKKIPTLFTRIFQGNKIIGITEEVTNDCEFVLQGKGIATVKVDGSCCSIINGVFYKRYDAKNGKPIPENAIKCQEEPDAITGHMPCWIPVSAENKADKWFFEAFNNTKKHQLLTDGTYEAIGPHFQGNPYDLSEDSIVLHGALLIDELNTEKRSFSQIKEWLRNNNVEGIVFWVDGKPKCKIKRSDFGFNWNKKL